MTFLYPLHLRLRKPAPYPTEPHTIGEHLLRRRLLLGHTQRQVARQLGASVASLTNWEKGRNEPEARHYPAILEFLGYDPFPPGESFGERLKAARLRAGFTQRELAAKLGLDAGTVAVWEKGGLLRVQPRVAAILAAFVDGREGGDAEASASGREGTEAADRPPPRRV